MNKNNKLTGMQLNFIITNNISEHRENIIISYFEKIAFQTITLSPPDMENVENRRISVRTYRLLAILSCHRDVLQDSLFILKTAYRQKSDL